MPIFHFLSAVVDLEHAVALDLVLSDLRGSANWETLRVAPDAWLVL
jgi:hypothetical protein